MDPQVAPMLLRPRAAARAMGIGESTLRKLIKEGNLPAVRFGEGHGSMLFVRIQDIEEFGEKHLIRD